jgi:hypothetical protein
MSQVTIFKNIKDTSTPFFRDISDILNRIKSGKSEDVVRKIRSEKNKDKRNMLKQSLPAICFSGTFNKRNDSSLLDHSGYICLDFDNYPNKQEMMTERSRIIADKHVYCCFISPSGEGLKVLVRVPKEPENHKYYFMALKEHFNSDYFDTTSKNISRVCYESFDPTMHINNESEEWTKKYNKAKEYDTSQTITPKIKLSDSNEIIRRLTLWWDKNYGIVEGERNNNMFILASKFNQFGISKDFALFALKQYSHEGFDESEISQIVNSAYRNTSEHKTRFFEDVEKVDEIREKLKGGVPKKEIVLDLRESGVDDDTINYVISDIEDSSHVREFWTINQKGTINLMHYEFKEFLEENGYFKYSPEGTKNYVFVKVTNNLIDNTSEDEIKDFVLSYVEKVADRNVYNFFADKTRFFKEDFLTMLSHVDVYFVQDTKDVSFLYYRNCAVRVTCDEITIVDYIDLGGYVWKNQVIQRDFKVDEVADCDYKKFITNIAGMSRAKTDDDVDMVKRRIKSIESTIGYLLHGYKNLGYCPAVIINDEVITDNPEGGTGKGIFVNAIGQMKSNVVMDGKSFSFEKSFAYQLVSADTQILTFDDVRKHFDFERLFSIVTEGITLEKKNKDAIKIPFNKSPKIIITTNYAIKGKGNSFERRKWEIEFTNHYSKDYTPEDEFGRLLFSDWDEDEWLRFDNYMISNLRLYLCSGFVSSEFTNLETRKFQAETDYSFHEWLYDKHNNMIKMNEKLYTQDLHNAFVADYSDFSRLSQQRFNKWLKAYGLYETGIEPEFGRDRIGKWVMFVDI